MAAVDVSLEGPIEIQRPPTGSPSLSVFGRNVPIPAALRLKTPTKRISQADFFDPASFPGRTEKGFDGGTAIVAGTFETTTNALTVKSINVEPAENVLTGPLQTLSPPVVNGTTIALLPTDEPRMPGNPPMNEYGFPAVMNDKVLNLAATAEGYYAGGKFQAHTLQVDPIADLVSNDPQISIERGRFRDPDVVEANAGRFRVRGFVTMMHAAGGVTQQRIEVLRLDNGVATSLGFATARRLAGAPRFARWELRADLPVTSDPVLSASPETIRAINRSPGANNATVEADTDIR